MLFDPLSPSTVSTPPAELAVTEYIRRDSSGSNTFSVAPASAAVFRVRVFDDLERLIRLSVRIHRPFIKDNVDPNAARNTRPPQSTFISKLVKTTNLPRALSLWPNSG